MAVPLTLHGQPPLAPAYSGQLLADAIRLPRPDELVYFPWADLHALMGPLVPGTLHIVSARTGSGKSTFIVNWLAHLLEPAEGHTKVAYFPLEVPGAEILQRLACLELRVDPRPVLVGDCGAIAGGWPAFASAVEAVDKRYLRGDQRLWLYDVPRVTVPALSAALRQAVREGCRVAVIDHLLRLALNEDRLFAAVSRAVRDLAILAKETGLVLVVTSQQSRETFKGDRLAQFAAPDLSALKGAGAIEEEADSVLFLHRLLREDLSPSQMTDVRTGRIPLQDAVQAHVMACTVGKHRRDGSKTGAQCRLWFDRQRLVDLPDDYRREWEAAKEGIRTGGRL